MTPREELTVRAWVIRRRCTALMRGEVDAPMPAVVRPLVAGVALAVVAVIVVHLH